MTMANSSGVMSGTSSSRGVRDAERQAAAGEGGHRGEAAAAAVECLPAMVLDGDGVGERLSSGISFGWDGRAGCQAASDSPVSCR